VDRRWGSKFQTERLASSAILFSATLWGLIWYPMRWLEGQGMQGAWATLLMYLVALLPGLWLSLRHWRRLRDYPWLLVGLAVSNGWANLAFVLAVIEGNVVRALLLFYLYPIWSIFIGWVFLHERPGRADLRALLLAILGAGVVLWSPEAALGGLQRSDLLAISAGLAFAIANALIRSLQALPLPLLTQVTWVGVCLVAMFYLVGTRQAMPDLSLSVGWVLLLMGAIGVVSMTLAVQYGVQNLPLYRSATLLLFEVLVGAVSSQLLSAERMGLVEWLGGGLILLGAYTTFREQKGG